MASGSESSQTKFTRINRTSTEQTWNITTYAVSLPQITLLTYLAFHQTQIIFTKTSSHFSETHDQQLEDNQPLKLRTAQLRNNNIGSFFYIIEIIRCNPFYSRTLHRQEQKFEHSLKNYWQQINNCTTMLTYFK